MTLQFETLIHTQHKLVFSKCLPAVMNSVRFCLLLLLSVHLVREGDGMITGPRSRRELGQVEPRTIEVEAGEDLSELLEKEAEPERRYVHMWS